MARLGQWQAMLSGPLQTGSTLGNAPPAATPPAQSITNPNSQGPSQAQVGEQPPGTVRPGAPLQPGVGAPQGGFVPGLATN